MDETDERVWNGEEGLTMEILRSVYELTDQGKMMALLRHTSGDWQQYGS